ncbi:hypothetical protein GN244_ATG15110 [Phytophthora infestans]|uniref:Uncharacterized protein n=1 Tax=Phytophthora infestans TaxID=4787 RepID=A0A833SDS0_PHYIN|nr:hypothetical protein GN244_ATG15110 [Phytophthora infestans]
MAEGAINPKRKIKSKSPAVVKGRDVGLVSSLDTYRHTVLRRSRLKISKAESSTLLLIIKDGKTRRTVRKIGFCCADLTENQCHRGRYTTPKTCEYSVGAGYSYRCSYLKWLTDAKPDNKHNFMDFDGQPKGERLIEMLLSLW